MTLVIAQVRGDESFTLGCAAGAVRESQAHVVPRLAGDGITFDGLHRDAPVIRTLIFSDPNESLWGECRDGDHEAEIQHCYRANSSDDCQRPSAPTAECGDRGDDQTAEAGEEQDGE